MVANKSGYIRRVADRAVVRYRNNPDELADADKLTEDEPPAGKPSWTD